MFLLIFFCIIKIGSSNSLAFKETWVKILLQELHQGYEYKTFSLGNHLVLNVTLSISLTFITTEIVFVLFLRGKMQRNHVPMLWNILANQR